LSAAAANPIPSNDVQPNSDGSAVNASNWHWRIIAQGAEKLPGGGYPASNGALSDQLPNGLGEFNQRGRLP
jgi:hypothetical protein